jgi:hypothetical protein
MAPGVCGSPGKIKSLTKRINVQEWVVFARCAAVFTSERWQTR